MFFFSSGFIDRKHSSVILFISIFKVCKILLPARDTARVWRAEMSASVTGNCQCLKQKQKKQTKLSHLERLNDSNKTTSRALYVSTYKV